MWYAVAAAVVVGLWWFLIAPARRRHPHRRVLEGAVIAHRGLHGGQVPENSLPAFRAAIRQGLPIEIDIHITADNQLVVFHDDTLKRVCGVDGKIADCTLAQLKGYRLNGTDCTIPTLQECLDTVAGQVPLLIEFKCLDTATCRRLCEAADEVLRRYEGLYWVQSFYPFVLQWYRRHRPEICRGQLSLYSEKGLAKQLLGKQLLNWISRPDFISYEYPGARRLNFRLAVGLGAHPVGWTFPSQQELDAYRPYYRTYIFENFLPKT